MNKPVLFFQTIFKLGILNVAYIGWYRFTIKTGLRKYLFPVKTIQSGNIFFKQCPGRIDYPIQWESQLIIDADRIVSGQIRYYGYHWKTIGNPPDWFINPFENSHFILSGKHWTTLSDFDPSVGDIKNIWEASRFEWVVTLSRAYAVSGNTDYLQKLNEYVNNWVTENPVNIGPNWSSGQEASIRVFNLINASLILSQSESPAKTLTDLIYVHLQRISSNICYAIAQNNNHGTSEAAALFIGGNLLYKLNQGHPKAKYFADKGRYWLENRIDKLVGEDGSFSQYSVTYHRVLVDTLIFTEYWRQKLNLHEFTPSFYSKARAGVNWLWMLTDELSGNCPNLGSNDGAMFLNSHSCNFRDFRPSLQTGGVIFSNRKYFSDGDWNEPLYWFNLNSSKLTQPGVKKESRLLKGGYLIINSSRSWGLLRFPNFRFRPSQNDVFHFDLWYNGKNILCDAGTYSYYNTSVNNENDLASVHYHNTVSFDNGEQMPRIGRFLLGRWIIPEETGTINLSSEGVQSWKGSYKDGKGNYHQRIIRTSDEEWVVEDILSGNFKTAEIGFNLFPDDYNIVGNSINAKWGQIELMPGINFQIIHSLASYYYREKHEISRLIIPIDQPGVHTLRVKLNQ